MTRLERLERLARGRRRPPQTPDEEAHQRFLSALAAIDAELSGTTTLPDSPERRSIIDAALATHGFPSFAELGDQ